MPRPIASDPLMTEGRRVGHHFQSQGRRCNGDSHSGYELLRKSGERTHQHCKEDDLLHERSADGEVDSRTVAQPDGGPHVVVTESVMSNPTLPPKRYMLSLAKTRSR